MKKELQKRLTAEAERLGFDHIIIDRSHPHPRLYTSKNGQPCDYVQLANTPSDWRALKNTFKTLRQIARGTYKRHRH